MQPSSSFAEQDEQPNADSNPVRYLIGRPIVSSHITDEEIADFPASDVTSISTGTPAGSLPSSQGKSRRPPPPVPSSPPVRAPTFNIQDVDATSRPSRNADLYSNLASFSFGNQSSSSLDPSYEADGEVGDLVSPLTPMVRRHSVDRTPRSSVAAPGKAIGSHSTQQNPGRHPSNASASTSHNRPASTSTYTVYDDEEDDDNDTVGFDYQPRRGRRTSDTASQHTFGGGRGSGIGSSSSSRSNSQASVRSAAPDFSSEDEVELDFDPHGSYMHGGLDPDDSFGGHHIDPPLESRRGSLPLAIPGSLADNSHLNELELRNREDSLATLRRPSRSVDDDLRMMSTGQSSSSIGGSSDGTVPKSEPLSRADFRSLESQQQQQQQAQQQAPPQATEEFDIDYILGGERRNSIAPSYVQRPNGQAEPGRQSLGFLSGGWGAGLAWSAARKQSASVTEDTFFNSVKRFNPEYEVSWSFLKEKADGSGGAAMSVRSGNSREPLAEERARATRTTMVPGMQEIWRNIYVGRFKVDRLALRSRSQDPSKPPQQRLNIRHIIDPYSQGNRHGGPSSVVHKHSKAVAFSIFRDYQLLSRSTAAGATSSIIGPVAHRPMTAQSGGIMLAPKKVQEQYTSTRTTSKLTTHGLLGDETRTSERSSGTARPHVRTNSQKEQQEKKEKDIKKKEKDEKKRREKEEKEAKKSRSKRGQQPKIVQEKSVDPESADSSSTAHSIVTDSTRVEIKQRRNTENQIRGVVESRFPSERQNYEPPASPATSTTISVATTLKKQASFESSMSSTDGSSVTVRADQAVQPTEPQSAPPQEQIAPVEADKRPDVSRGRVDEDEDDEGDDDLISPAVTRTPHAEAFAALDPNTIEYVRARGHRGMNDGHNVHWSRRWFPPFARPTKTITYGPAFPSGPSSAVIESTYVPPWMVIAGRSAQESNERLIQNLNDSFKDVGLVHSRPSKPAKKKRVTLDLFNEVPEDALYMLLPLWAQETDETSLNGMRVADAFPPIAVDERQYLLVFYDSFGQAPPGDATGSSKKKVKRTSPQSSMEPMDPKTVILSEFKVSARLVGYAELKGTGVRLPNTGLSVTGPPQEAIEFMPPLLPSEELRHDFTIIAHCYGRDKGVVFESMGVDKLGLCMPRPIVEEPVHSDYPQSSWNEYDEPEEPVILLSPIGRAAVEMVWLGCLAMTSFGAM